MTRIYHETSSGGKLRTKRRLGGFTLIELLVVVLIIGILTAVAWPKYELAIMKARMVEIYKWGDYASREAELFYLANGRYPSTFLELGVVVPGCNQSENYFNGCPGNKDISIVEISNGGILIESRRYPMRYFHVFEQKWNKPEKKYCWALTSYPKGRETCQKLSGNKPPVADWFPIYPLE